jgi:heat induced stress protein YflT
MSTHQGYLGQKGTVGRPRRTVASYATYQEAERAVDHLADERFPVERVSIVGRGLEFVEQVTGRMGYREAALRGAVSGALVGALVGWLFGLFDWFDPLLAAAWLAFQGLWFGALVGAFIGLGLHALMRGRRDFVSVAGMRAEGYEVVADDEVAEEAARLLAGFTDATPVAPVPTARGKSDRAA